MNTPDAPTLGQRFHRAVIDAVQSADVAPYVNELRVLAKDSWVALHGGDMRHVAPLVDAARDVAARLFRDVVFPGFVLNLQPGDILPGDLWERGLVLYILAAAQP